MKQKQTEKAPESKTLGSSFTQGTQLAAAANMGKALLKKKSKPKPRYRSAKSLEITKGEKKWLLKTAKVLSRMEPNQEKKIQNSTMQFYLGEWFDVNQEYDLDEETGNKIRTQCGTVGCIHGWAVTLAIVAGKGHELGINLKLKKKDTLVELNRAPIGDRYSDALQVLFSPDNVSYRKVTPKMAAKAIKSFLKTGEPDWGDAACGEY